MLALSRILLVPVIMAFTRSDEIENALVIAAIIFTVAAFTDFLDGYVARKTSGGTTLGAFLDTTADKILITGTLLALVSVGRVSIWPAAIIIFREFTVMALRGVAAQRGGLIRPSTWGKIKFGAQYLAILLAFFRLSHRWGFWYLDQWVMLLAVIATVGSAWGYLAAFSHHVRSEPDPART
jgi:CDP-diacylglycerol---glycerol-3-phosphate 3-phosphatidyltransferase